MYGFITHTWNVIRSIPCYHGCLYCYMLVSEFIELMLAESEFRCNLGSGKFIFLGSSTDMWATNVPSEWIQRILDYCDKFDNHYLFQSKNPARFLQFIGHPIFQSRKAVLATTIETNRWDPYIMNNAPQPCDRAKAMAAIAARGIQTMVTVEPAMAFDHDKMLEMILACNPIQVNIGRNTADWIQLPEPTRDEVQDLIADLSNFTTVHVKPNASVWM